MGNALSLKTEDLAVLGAPGNFQFFRSYQGRHLDIVSQGRLDKGNRNPADNVVIGALEEFMFFDVDENIKISAGTAMFPLFTFPAQPEAGACLDTGRNLDLDGFGNLFPAGAPALLAGVGDDLSHAATIRTGGADTEEAAGLGDLTAAATT